MDKFFRQYKCDIFFKRLFFKYCFNTFSIQRFVLRVNEIDFDVTRERHCHHNNYDATSLRDSCQRINEEIAALASLGVMFEQNNRKWTFFEIVIRDHGHAYQEGVHRRGVQG